MAWELRGYKSDRYFKNKFTSSSIASFNESSPSSAYATNPTSPHYKKSHGNERPSVVYAADTDIPAMGRGGGGQATVQSTAF